MRRREDVTTEAVRDLAAIDAALAGDAVAPEDAELAELTTLLADGRPLPRPSFAAALDARVADRFASPLPGRGGGAPSAARTRHVVRRPLFAMAAATALATVAALVIVAQPRHGMTAVDAGGGASSADSAVAPAPRTAPSVESAASGTASGTAALSTAGETSARKVVRSATLDLGAPADRIPGVARDVLGVVARFDGIVDRSNVTGGTGSDGATFALRFPAARLEPALAGLSRLSHAHVLGRSDDLRDVNQTYVSTRHRLAAARAERIGLLRSLQAGGTVDELTRLRERLAVVEQTIAVAERDQRALDRRIAYSRVALTVEADDASSGGSSFTPGRALHDAGHLLTVMVGVIVIAAGVLLPFALLLVLAWPFVRTVRRRQREQALDVV